MNLGQIFRSALLTLRTQKLRTVLTLFGMVWGTASVVFLMSWGLGLERMLDDGFNKIGNNVVHVWAGTIGEDFTPALDRRKLWFSIQDVEADEGDHLIVLPRLANDLRGLEVTDGAEFQPDE